MPCPVWSIRPLSGGVNIIVAKRFSGASPPTCRPRLCGNRRSSSHIALFIEGGRVSVAIVADVNFPFPSFPFTCAFYLFIRQPMGRKSALRREILWILRGFQGRLSC